ncbi:MAG: glycosyltransferase [Actinobacteria bacterium]|nr:glycosyltransferase [Actinomycetota bacterium]
MAEPEVSVLIPCLNEEQAIDGVIRDAFEGLRRAGVSGEVLVIDNGSEDRSVEVAEEAGATVVHEPRRGYGSAYLAGLDAAQGRYVVMADGDGTYDLRELGDFVNRLRNGADLVLGTRLKGDIEPGAMPWSHRYIGNPILTGMLRLLFGRVVSDAHCGLRALKRQAVPELGLSATGMEFASEMVIKAAKQGLEIDEVEIAYRTRVGESKLNSFRDAWRHVRFMLVYSPTFLFAIPGGLMCVAGLGALTWLGLDNSLPESATGWAIASAVVALLGAQVLQLGLFARTFAVAHLREKDETLERLWQRLRLEHGLAASAGFFITGAGVAIYSYFNGTPDPRLGLLGMTLLALGVQGVFGSFFLSVLGRSAPRHRPHRKAERELDPVERA